MNCETLWFTLLWTTWHLSMSITWLSFLYVCLLYCRHCAVHALGHTFRCWILAAVLPGEKSAAVSRATAASTHRASASCKWVAKTGTMHQLSCRRHGAVGETTTVGCCRSYSRNDRTFRWYVVHRRWNLGIYAASSSAVFLNNTYVTDCNVFPGPGNLKSVHYIVFDSQTVCIVGHTLYTFSFL